MPLGIEIPALLLSGFIMNARIGRNDPCPCGSGKKYKHCHLPIEAQPATLPATEPQAAVERTIAWLNQRHRQAFGEAINQLLDDLWPEDAPSDTPYLGDDTKQTININLLEWLLAEGDILVKGQLRRVNELVREATGPRLSEAQRHWILQLSERPLRLYTVTDVRPGESITLCDALDADALPLLVQERMGSQSVTPGMLIGCRVITVGEHLDLSGAIYSFSNLANAGAMAAARTAVEANIFPEDQSLMMGLSIATAWLRQLIMPLPKPTMVDMSTGEPILLVTDHYRVMDAAALARALAACDDVSGNAQTGWRHEIDCEDGLVRPLAAINPGKQADRIEVLYRTQRYADEGRVWFDAVVGETAHFHAREISDLYDERNKHRQAHALIDQSSTMSEEQKVDALEQAVLRTYARWPEQPIPILHGKTPRESASTPAGLERVKGLLRYYESNEAGMAARDGRRTISFQFLWDALEITR